MAQTSGRRRSRPGSPRYGCFRTTTPRRWRSPLVSSNAMALEEASPAPILTAVVLHYRNWPLVADTIRSLRAQTVPVPVVLVDNASGDGSVDGITKEFPGMRVVQSPVNGGYAAGMNLGRQQV